MRSLMKLGMVAAAAATMLLVSVGPASADPGGDAVDYVALGDSYSSGTGTREYFDSGCQRSHHSYPAQLAVQHGYTLTFDACSGARIADVRNEQLGNLSAETDLITVSAGGNDTGWTDVLVSCARPWPWTCWGDIDRAENFIRTTLPGRLDALYTDIAAAAPGATVIVVGYPRLFNGETCNFAARISAGEQERLNAAADLLSDTTEAVAADFGFTYLDARDAFDGHAVCDDVEWLNGLSNPIGESYHPNRLGHDGYTREVTALL
ncbi:GDSL-like lipase/acylhydrolase family protein [Stackebrandtia albiflava]|uniref:GDSL-like lipase/acylhydrolase family protein n=1 Tax=Stackebrandtia albiflava TaxID=406432 RepID=A0A562V4T3_9ACTN|nr:SGNH/GDSL hydrolase family protein [Stackebrandtia albiflava]TWJ12896.1 GDSL-like lipase/acylhydrolase family protein [Stackebrandtia albiflava]